MKIYRKTPVVFLNFKKKKICRINWLKSKRFVKVQMSIICLNNRPNTCNKSIKKVKYYPKDLMVKSKNIRRNTEIMMTRLRIRLSILMRLTAKWGNLMRLYDWSLPYIWSPYQENAPSFNLCLQCTASALATKKLSADSFQAR